MQAFRAAFRDRDSQKEVTAQTAAGEIIIAGRRSTPRNSVGNSILREELAEDLSALLNTINLASADDLDGFDEVQRSILNFGINDLTAISADSNEAKGLASHIENVLLHHEDRLVDGSVRLATETVMDEASARIAVHINAEMHASPTDLAVEFIADVEAYSGKIKVKKA